MPAEMPSKQAQTTTESWSEFAALVAAALTVKAAAVRTRAPQIARTIVVTRRYRWATWMVLMAVVVGWDYGSDAASQVSALTGLGLVAIALIEIVTHVAMKAARGTKRALKR